MHLSLVIALTIPASTLAVVLTTEHDAGVSEVAVTVDTLVELSLSSAIRTYEQFLSVGNAINMEIGAACL